jgi:general secretion pathway protein D
MIRGIFINVLILGFLLTLYIYINTDNNKTIIQENFAQTTELEDTASDYEGTSADISYKIEVGDSLSTIGDKFQVSVNDIRELNGLRDNVIVAGDYIDIPQIPSQNSPGNASQDNNIVLAQAYEGVEDKNENVQAPDENIEARENQASQDLRAQEERKAERERRRQEMMQKREELQKKRLEQRNGKSETVSEPDTGETKSHDAPAEIIITDGEIVNLQAEMDIQDLIQTISEITSENFILDESVKGKKVTIIAPGGFKRENAMRLFETILSLNGFSIVKKDDINIIVPKRDIKIKSIPTEVGNEYGEPSDRFITRLIQLDNIKANDAANILKPLISREGDVVVYPALNMLIIIETVDNLNRVLKIIENLDVETEIEFIKIENAEASEVATKLVEIFAGTGSSTSSATRTTRTAERQTSTQRSRSSTSRSTQSRAQQPAISSQSTADSSAVGFKVITDERTNSLIIIAYPEDMAKIKAVVEILDAKTDIPEDGIFVIRVLNADAEQLVSVLSALFGGGVGGFGRGAISQRTQGIGSRGTFGGGRGTFGGQSTFGGLGGQTGIGTGTGRSRQNIQRQATTGLSSVVAQTAGLRITADPATNSVIVIGSRRDYETIKEVIDKLDIRRKQVFVEAAILEVSLDKLRSFGTNLSIGFTVNDSTLGFGGTVLPGVPSLLGVAANPEASVNLLGSLSGLFLGVVGEEVDPDGSGPIPPIPSFTALFQAITSLTDVNVLSTPSIITTDNEPAEIIVADVIPFPTGSTVGDGGVTVQTIDREPVGIRLSITPQISEGDLINLNILTEVSAIRETPVAGLNTAQFGIATTTRTADSSVIVKNGQTIVIGGLVQDRESILQNRVPVLGRIPFLGNLFKFKQRVSQKLNLMILLTPRIVETQLDMQRILEERQKRNMLLQERGFNREEPN